MTDPLTAPPGLSGRAPAATSPIQDQAAEPPGAQAAITSDFNTFLKMLTTQITNQDPLEPMKAEEFAVQLATFSAVEQQVRGNQILEQILAAQTGGGPGGLSGMAAVIGREARAVMPVHVEDGAAAPVRFDRPPPLLGDRHELVVRDANGAEITRQRVGDLGGPGEWNGRDASGRPVPGGAYRLSIESFEAGALAATEPLPVYGRVTEIRLEAGGRVMVFGGGIAVPEAEITALAEPAGGVAMAGSQVPVTGG